MHFPSAKHTKKAGHQHGLYALGNRVNFLPIMGPLSWYTLITFSSCLEPLFLIPQPAARYEFSPLVSMGISDRMRRKFSLKKPGRKASSNYEYLICIPSTGILGK